MPSFIRIEGLRKSFKNNLIINGMDLAVDEGEILILKGPSGIGKSTLLRCLNYLETFQAGRISVGDFKLYAGMDQHRERGTIQRVRERMPFLFQFFNLFPHLTVLENLTIGPVKVLGRRPEEARADALKLLHRVGLGYKAATYPSSLSGGQCQRVAIARALAMKPNALLLDEPTSSLDPDTKKEIVDIIAEFTHENLTMIIVTHEAAFIERIATRIIKLGPQCSILSDDRVHILSAKYPPSNP